MAKKKSILIVEDKIETVASLTDHLELEGYLLQSTGKLKEALFKVRNQRYDCILIDINLEQGSGDRLVEYIRNDSHNQNFETPLFIMSLSLIHI